MSDDDPSSSSDDSSSEDDEPQMSLQEIRAFKLRRNQALLERLGLTKQILASTAKRKAPKAAIAEEPELPQRRGMLLSRPAPPNMDELYKLYPHREMQLRRLLGLLGSATTHLPTIPVPILVTGPRGTGKTAILRDLSMSLRSEKVASVYVDCGAVDAPAIEELVRSIHRQFKAQVAPDACRPMKKKARRFRQGDNRGNDQRKDRTHLSRAAAPEKMTTAEQQVKSQSVATNTDYQSTVSLTSVYKLGRNLKALFGSSHCGILVLDHAERLMNLANKKRLHVERPNFLAQLFVLPQCLGVNLTVVAVTTSMLLDHTRLCPLVAARDSLSTISGAVQPIQVQFPPYRSKGVLKDVMKQPHVRDLIVGESDKISRGKSFGAEVYNSFLETFVQSFRGTTWDVKELLQIARRLWPKYIFPLRDAGSIEKLSKTSSGTDIELAEVLSVLDKKLLPAIRHELENGLYALEPVASSSEVQALSPICKYLLLAAFVCQVNSADQDKSLFSIQKNGRRRRQDADRDAEEDTAFGADKQSNQASKVFRTRSFPMERMLSVFVSLVGLNKSDSLSEEKLRSLGNSAFFENMAQLRGMQLLHEQPNRAANEAARLSEPRYSCSLTLEEAQHIASEMNFPLDRYVQ